MDRISGLQAADYEYVAAMKAKTLDGAKFAVGNVLGAIGPEMRRNLRTIAMTYASAYDGDFGFMREMQVRGLDSWGKVAATLNCLLADRRFRPAPAAPQRINSGALVPGYYQAEGCLAVRIAQSTRNPHRLLASAKVDGRWAYVGSIDKVTWSLSTSIDNWEAQTAVANVLNGHDLETLGLRFATATGRCRACGATLTVDASLLRGYGPTCAKRLGIAAAAHAA